MLRFSEFGNTLRVSVEANLAGFDRRPVMLDGRRPAAVAVTILPDERNQASFLLTRRAGALRRHRGQWALPGGRIDADESPADAAQRELEEELGVPRDEGTVLGLLDDFATRSGFVITPVVLWIDAHQELRPDPKEVAVVHLVQWADLDRPDVPFLQTIPESDRPVLSMPILGDVVFAPTAAMIYQMLEVGLRGETVRVAEYEQPLFAWH